MSRGVSTTKLTLLPAKATQFPWDVDLRSKPAREIAAIATRLATDLGGVEALSTQQLALVERASFQIYRIRQHESAVLAGREPPFDAGTHSNYCNVLTGVLKALGLERRARNIRSLREVMQGSK